MDKSKYDVLKLENQICFPLYACSKEVIKRYRPYLKQLNLTYTQYIAMMVLWEYKKVGIKELGRKLFLDSGTLTPVLKSLESKGYIRRYRSSEDERVLIAEITDSGEKLKEQAIEVPSKLAACVQLDSNDAVHLYNLLYKLLATFNE